MKQLLKGIAAGVVALSLLILVHSRPVYAISSCAVGSTCIENLTSSNIIQLDGNIDIRVVVDNTQTFTRLFFQFDSDSITNLPLGIDHVFYNASALVNSVDPGVPGVGILTCTGSGNDRYCGDAPLQWHVNFDGGIADGFGTLASNKSEAQDGLNVGGIADPIVLTLDSLITSFAPNSQGAEFAVHIRYAGNCSGFVSDGAAASMSANLNCGVVPEPAPLLLLGSGLLGLGLLARKWMIGDTGK